MRISSAILLLSTSILAGCLGGGKENIRPDSYVRPQVPFHTPVHVATVTTLTNGDSVDYTIASIQNEDLSRSGSDNVIIAGRQSAGDGQTSANHSGSRISVLGWANGTLVDQTSQWFNPGENVINGTEYAVQFGQFTNSGYKDMVVGPSTDGITADPGPAYVYFNNGSTFTRTAIPMDNINPTELARPDSRQSVWSHDFTIASLRNNGVSDIIFSDYGWNTTLAFNNGNNTFTTYTQQNRILPGNSSIAAADFLRNGTTTLFAVDSGGPQNLPGLYSWNITNNNLNFTKLWDGPLPIFEQPQWKSTVAPSGSHNIRAVAHDFNTDGASDVIVISRPGPVNGSWPSYSAIQFLKNDGTGHFTDVTNDILIGYNHNTVASYNPRFIDLFGTGRQDILLAGAGDFTGNNNSFQILLKGDDGKYRSAFQSVLKDFATQANALKGADNSGNTINIIQSPDNKMYLVTAVNFRDGGTQRQAVYMSLMGGNASTFTTAQQTISQMQSQWPWMSSVQANTILAQTAQSYLGIGSIIDPDAAMAPAGALTLALGNRNIPLSGTISGVQASPEVTRLMAVDTFGRNYSINFSPTSVATKLNYWNYNTEIDQKQLTSHAEFLVNGSINTVNGMRIAQDPTNFSAGTPAIPLNENWSWNMQYTSLGFNPWFVISGAWGQVKNSTIIESVNTYRNDNFQAQFGIMNVATNIESALITRVSNMQGVWAEAGFVEQKWGVYAGVKPIIVNGAVEATLPTSVDYRGNIQYTNTKMNFQNPINGYVRAMYSGNIKKYISYKLSGMVVDNGHFRVQSELRINY